MKDISEDGWAKKMDDVKIGEILLPGEESEQEAKARRNS